MFFFGKGSCSCCAVQNGTSLRILGCGWGENHSPLTATLSRSGSGAAAPTGLLPPLLGPPPQGAPHTCVTGPAGISLTTPPSWIPVTVCLFSALCICTLLLMLIISSSPAHCSCITAIQLTAHASASAQAFTCFSCTCSLSRSLLPDAYIDILHNSQGLLSTHVR